MAFRTEMVNGSLILLGTPYLHCFEADAAIAWCWPAALHLTLNAITGAK